MKSKCLIVLVALLVLGMDVQTANTQTRKAGINSAAFLKVGVGARQVGLGSAVTSLTGDINNMFWNPAGVAMRDQSLQASFTHNNWIAGLEQEVAAVTYNMQDVGTIGVGVMMFGVSGIPADRDYGYTDPQLHVHLRLPGPPSAGHNLAVYHRQPDPGCDGEVHPREDR